MRPNTVGLIVMIGLAMLAVLALNIGDGNVTLLGGVVNGVVIGLVLSIGRWVEVAESNRNTGPNQATYKHRGKR